MPLNKIVSIRLTVRLTTQRQVSGRQFKLLCDWNRWRPEISIARLLTFHFENRESARLTGKSGLISVVRKTWHFFNTAESTRWYDCAWSTHPGSPSRYKPKPPENISRR